MKTQIKNPQYGIGLFQNYSVLSCLTLLLVASAAHIHGATLTFTGTHVVTSANPILCQPDIEYLYTESLIVTNGGVVSTGDGPQTRWYASGSTTVSDTNLITSLGGGFDSRWYLQDVYLTPGVLYSGHVNDFYANSVSANDGSLLIFENEPASWHTDTTIFVTNEVALVDSTIRFQTADHPIHTISIGGLGLTNSTFEFMNHQNNEVSASSAYDFGTLRIGETNSIVFWRDEYSYTEPQSTYTLQFDDSSSVSWDSNGLLKIYNWEVPLPEDPCATGGHTEFRIFVGNDDTALTSTQLGKIQFVIQNSDNTLNLSQGVYSAALTSSGELVPD